MSEYKFLNLDKIKNYDDLNSLFFQVLARKHDERSEDVKQIFQKVPYLNSSLFEPTDIEQDTLFISNLKDDKTIPIFSQTVLKDQQGKKRTGNISTLQYLLEFLDAYDFGAEGGEEIQEDNKTLINASVLGLIFEKINGYKDGSFFTPGFITMYMCRETIRKAVVQKFNEAAAKSPLERGFRGVSLRGFRGVSKHLPDPPQGGNVGGVSKHLPDPPQGGNVGGVSKHLPSPPQGGNVGGVPTPLLRGAGGVFMSVPRREIIPYNPALKELARELRNNSTKSEILLWKELKGKFEGKYDFHRQKPLDNYIADFFCHELMLVIEIDGETHNWEETQRKDFQKETRLNELGLNVLRFPDSDIFNHLESTLETIKQYIIGFEKGDLSELQYEDSPLNPLTGNVVEINTLLNPLSRETHPLPLSRGENDTPLNPIAGVGLENDTPLNPLSRGENETPLNPLSRGDFKSLEDVYEQIGEGRLFTRQQANEIVNSIKICDPAVGSGHFLVSALNEIIAVKNDLKILQDRDGKRLKEYQVEVVNDELIVTDEEGALFEYTPPSPLKRGERGVSKHLPYPPQGGNARGVSESQRVQETLFHEKQTIIENCLFGVDINSNSVKICRLRLWIELLKNAYYKDISTLSGAEAYTKLETLPNIDINIKCGNSLVSRFAIDADLKQALKKSKWTIDSYRIAVATYRNAESKEQKREMERLIAGIKSDFRSEISANDPKIKKLRKLSGDLYQMTNQGQLFEMSQKEKADWNKRVQQLTQEISKLEAEIEEIKSNKIFENAFEWRFEFPEVLNDDGDFVGFDVVIGNPPYISTKEISPENKLSYSINYKVAVGQFDLYLIFTELAFNILKQNGSFSFITSNTYISNKDCLRFREFIVRNTTITEIINLDETIFTDAHLDVGILSFVKIQPSSEHAILIAKNKDEFLNGVRTKYFISRMVNSDSYEIKFSISEKDWLLFDKMNVCPKLKNFVTITRGIEFGGNSNEIFDNPFEDSYPILVGNSIGKYQIKEIKGYSRYNHNELAVFKPLEIYTQPRILIQRIRNLSLKDRIIATFIEDSMLSTNTLRVLLRKNESTNLKYLLGILNSRLINYYFRLNFNNKDIYAYQLAEVPIKYDLYFEKEIIELVTQILEIKKNNPEISTAELENQIDQLVYQLYELTEDEIKIVEGNG